MTITNAITYEEANKLLEYNPETGLLKWKARASRRVFAGAVAGNASSNGYIRLSINNKLYQAHRIAWLLYYGHFPKQQIDHINRITTDNRICNLRDVGYSDNLKNKPLYKRNTSGYRGVCFYKQTNKWCAQIKKNGKQIHLGYFDNPIDASAAYQKAENELYGYLNTSPLATPEERKE